MSDRSAGTSAGGRLRAVGIVVGMPGITVRESVRFAEQAEAAGLDIVGAGEAVTENFSLVGALAARTQSLEVFSSVANWSRSPVTLALGASTLADLAGGRYRLGLGASPKDWSEGWHGVPYERPVERMRDLVAAIRAAWSSSPGQPIDYEGPFYRIRAYEHALPHAAPVPLYLGVTRPGMTQLGGAVADGVIFNLMQSVDWLQQKTAPALQAGLEDSGRGRSDIDVGMLAVGAVSDDPRQARDLARPGLGFYFAVPYFRDVLQFHGFNEELERGLAAAERRDQRGMAEAVTDRLVDAFALVGTPDDIARRLVLYADLVDWVEVMAPLGLDPDTTREQTILLIRALAEVRRR